MNPNEVTIMLATGPQCATLAQMVALALTKKFSEGKLSFSQAQIAITDSKQFVVNELAEKFVGEIFGISIDPWIEEKKKISHFYKSCFDDPKWKNPNWEQVTISTGKEELKRPEFIFSKMTVQEAFDAYALYFGKDKVWKAWDNISKAIDHETVQPRPGKNYAILHIGGDEPDLLNKSYDDGISENIIFMTPLEGIISAFRYRFETGKMYDVVGVTRLSALDRNGFAMLVYGDADGRFNVDGHRRGNRDPDRGLRQVSF